MFDVISYFIGSALLLMQVSNLFRLVVPDSRLTKSKHLTDWLYDSSVRSELGIKQASTIQVHEMVKNAYDLHEHNAHENQVNSHDALFNFTEVTEVTYLFWVRVSLNPSYINLKVICAQIIHKWNFCWKIKRLFNPMIFIRESG